MLKKILSYFIPINIHQQKSNLSKNLEVTWVNGQLVLDSQNTNYSYGSLQRILRKGLYSIGIDKVRNMEHILILGVAGGSVVKTLVGEIGYKGKITGVEIDADVITIANKYFALDQIPNLEIFIDDAFEFVLKTKECYDLIIVDIFRDTTMPNFLFESFFTNRLGELVSNNGIILFNTMLLNAGDEERNKQYLLSIDADCYLVRTLPRLENHNELIIISKKEK